jgi:hypothetical protein
MTHARTKASTGVQQGRDWSRERKRPYLLSWLPGRKSCASGALAALMRAGSWAPMKDDLERCRAVQKGVEQLLHGLNHQHALIVAVGGRISLHQQDLSDSLLVLWGCTKRDNEFSDSAADACS